jgi:hypothetical protein
VTSIGKSAFYGCESLQSFKIPDGVKEIGYRTFFCCTSLQSLTIPDSVTSIGESAFYGCNQIRKCVFIPGSADEAQCKMIVSAFGTEVLAIPFLLGNIETNPTLTKILKSKITAKAFRTKYISKLIEKQETEVFLKLLSCIKKMEPEEIDSYINFSVEKGTVEITNRLIEYQNKLYPIEKVFEMQNEEMEKAIGIREKTLADYRKEFGLNKDGDTIKSYKGKGPTVLIPGNIKGKAVKIAEKAFENCANIQVVYIDEGVTSIGDYAFLRCTSLQSITIPDSVTSITWGVFRGCESLQSVTIPDSVTNISEGAFRSCPNLSIYAPAGSYAERYAKEKNINFQAI